ncbi:ATP-binding cassette transporter [Schizopora paradoxa]|uniref:ATP-binding cassette transporter n=1 Tax=Schizopora paradoxa TaxID=27342 RepID=A0A0H2SQJ3_9AGAM|nr:ATP-binding cassette transporter [Schizopora paradoxa]
MPRLQLETGIFLCICCLSSLLRFVVVRRRNIKEGKIKLSFDDEDENNKTLARELCSSIFKVSEFADGYVNAIHEDEFWRKARTRKICVFFVTSAMAVVETIDLGWSIIEEDGTRKIWTNISLISFSLYLSYISAASVASRDVDFNRRSIFHVFSLTATALLLLTSSAILPPHGQDIRHAITMYLSISLVFSAFWISAGTKGGPTLHFSPGAIYSEDFVSEITPMTKNNVSESTGASPWDVMMFSFATRVIKFNYTDKSVQVGDLPIIPLSVRAGFLFTRMTSVIQRHKLRILKWTPKRGSGWELGYQLVRANTSELWAIVGYTLVAVVLFYVPYFFVLRLVHSLEVDPSRSDRSWGWWYCFGLFMSRLLGYINIEQLWLSTTLLQTRIKVELNTILFTKTLARKDIASSSAVIHEIVQKNSDGSSEDAPPGEEILEHEGEFSSKAQIMTLMTTDVDRVSSVAMQLFSIIDSPLEIAVATVFLYKLLGTSAFVGLAVTCLFLPVNHIAGKFVMGAQNNLMKARDERVSLMNEILGAIRMLKFMVWEGKFEARISNIRGRELHYQKLSYTIETTFNGIWSATPLIVTLVSFWHFAVFRGQLLTPSIAFTSIAIFSELRFALSSLPETIIYGIQGFVSLRRIEKYLQGEEIQYPPRGPTGSYEIVLQSATVSWPEDKSPSTRSVSVQSTIARQKFVQADMTLNFPLGELSLVCGKTGSGKTLLLLSLLGEVDLLSGQLSCPRSPIDTTLIPPGTRIKPEDWIVEGACAYVPQTAWLRNASIKDNILFSLPYEEERYNRTLECCALVSDLEVLEGGDESEIGERGVTLSGGQKARVSLARAVYSRASMILLDDVLSAVDAHTAHHLYQDCLKGDLMVGRTIILVSHHVRLCSLGAKYVVALENGRVVYSGDSTGFEESGVMRGLVESEDKGKSDIEGEDEIRDEHVAHIVDEIAQDVRMDTSTNDSHNAEERGISAPAASATVQKVLQTPASKERKPAKKLIDEENRAVGRIAIPVWETYLKANGSIIFWTVFVLFFLLAAVAVPLENAWLAYWSGAPARQDVDHDTIFYLRIYASISLFGLLLQTSRWFVLYNGSIRASKVLHERLLRVVLSAQIRFHDTISRGRLLNRFGKDFEGIDSSLAGNLGRSVENGISLTVTLCAITFVGGPLFVLSTAVLGILYYKVAKLYGQCGRDLRRLDSVTRSPLYSIYGETIAGVPVIRAFGASAKFMADMLRCVDTNSNPYYWLWMLNRWVAVRVNSLTSAIVGCIAVLVLLLPSVSAAQAGFALSFGTLISMDLVLLMRHFVGLEQAMVAVERVKEFSDLPQEGSEIVYPRPPASWPSEGRIDCEDLVVRYAPDLPDVLHKISFIVNPGEKIGVLGRTGSGKSTLALSFFRFVEATSGRIIIDRLDISKIGLSDLRSKLMIIPQDPTILSGTLRSVLDVFGEYQDAEIYEALRRVHLIPSVDSEISQGVDTNANVFRDLDSRVSEGGENFSAGEKQLLCMARAILMKSRILIMDEATASVDYATDELIGKTILEEFQDRTILTIAHRLRTVINFDRVMLLEGGRILEFDSPARLMSDTSSKFYALCRATGDREFSALQRLAEAEPIGA